jgi:hypothetical protein
VHVKTVEKYRRLDRSGQPVFVDETGVTTTLTRIYRRAERGWRVVDAVPQAR